MYNLCIFEDTLYRQLLPLTWLRPAYELACGEDSLLGKIIRYTPHENVILHVRASLKPLLKLSNANAMINQFTYAGSTLFINGRFLAKPGYLDTLETLREGKPCLYLNEDEEIVIAYLTGESLTMMNGLLEKGTINLGEVYSKLRQNVTTKKIGATLIHYPWELIAHHSDSLATDFKHNGKGGILKGHIATQACLKNEDQIVMDQGCYVNEFSVLDATEGPIILGKNVMVHPFSVLKGPLKVGDYSQILGGCLSRSFIGPGCKIHGEVTDSIILGFTNKSHEGFIGHSIIGEWVNLGALTTNSNLKNTYSPVTMIINDIPVNTHLQFLGALIGDHTKLGIGTLLNTGIVIGVAVNLYGGGLFDEKFIPSFVWGTTTEKTVYRLDKAIDTAAHAFKRRGQAFLDIHQATLTDLFALTNNERSGFLGSPAK